MLFNAAGSTEEDTEEAVDATYVCQLNTTCRCLPRNPAHTQTSSGCISYLGWQTEHRVPALTIEYTAPHKLAMGYIYESLGGMSANRKSKLALSAFT